MRNDVGEGRSKPEKQLARSAMVRDTLFHLSMGTTIVLGSCYAAFVVYIAMAYTGSWLDKLRLLPLLTVAVTAPLLGAVLVRKKHLMELRS